MVGTLALSFRWEANARFWGEERHDLKYLKNHSDYCVGNSTKGNRGDDCLDQGSSSGDDRW